MEREGFFDDERFFHGKFRKDIHAVLNFIVDGIEVDADEIEFIAQFLRYEARSSPRHETDGDQMVLVFRADGGAELFDPGPGHFFGVRPARSREINWT